MEILLKDFEIKAKNKIEFEDKIQKFNVKAAKLGFPNYSYTYGKVYKKGDEVIIPVKLLGVHSIKLNGWEFAATLNHIENNVLIFNSSDIIIPNIFQTSECEHCNINRARKQTFVLFNKEENKFIQVGSSCIKDFLRENVPENILKFTDFVNEVRRYLKSDSSNTQKDVFMIRDMLAITNATIREFGWVKSKSESEIPTATRVWGFLNSYDNSPTLTEFDFEKADQTINWISNLSDKELESSYLHNLKVIYDVGYVDSRTIGMGVSMSIAYDNSKPKIFKDSSYVGVVGEKRVFELTYKRCYEFFSNFGTMRIYAFEDAFGNAFVWKTSTFKSFEEEKSYFIKGTIKAHNLYKEKYKQTELTRCSIEKINIGDENAI